MPGSSSTLGPGPEFDLIRALTAGLRSRDGVVEGPGDDAAVLDGGWVVTCDLSVEQVHLRRDWLTPAEMGGRATSAALSDLAAMAAEPVAVLVSLAGSADDHASGLLAEVGRGARDAIEAAGAALVGGDVTRSPGPLIVDVIALGRAANPVLRRGARPGDDLWVTGRLGGAATAVRLWLAGEEPPAGVRARFASPRPRLVAARRLQAHGGLHAMLDVSDGVAGDAGHLAAASGVGLEIHTDAIPLEPWLAEHRDRAEALDLALHGGEDYELLFTADRGAAAGFEAIADELGLPLTRIGRVVEGEGVVLVGPGGDRRPAGAGFDHFGANSEGS